MLSPGEQPRSQPLSTRQLVWSFLVLLILAAVWFVQRRNIEEYRRYFMIDNPSVTFAFTDLSEEWSEKTLRERFPGVPVSCHPYQGPLPVDRACALDVRSHNGVPTLFIAFFFSKGYLDHVSVNVPSWHHSRAYKNLVGTQGPADDSQFLPYAGVRLHGWRLADGAGLFLNRDSPFNPLSWNAIYWQSASACAKAGCFKSEAPRNPF
jgi:hypothetical protein